MGRHAGHWFLRQGQYRIPTRRLVFAPSRRIGRIYDDTASGSVQYERGNNDKVREIGPPLQRLNYRCVMTSKSTKHKPQASVADKIVTGTKAANADVLMGSESKSEANNSPVTTRSKRGDH